IKSSLIFFILGNSLGRVIKMTYDLFAYGYIFFTSLCSNMASLRTSVKECKKQGNFWNPACVTPAAILGALSLTLIHISEPTRLLSISYAVFCLKKKKKILNTK